KELLLLERDAELFERPPDLGVDLVEAPDDGLRLRRGVVNDVLVVDGTVFDVAPRGLVHRLPDPIRLQPPLEQPLRLVLLGRDEPARKRLLLDIGNEAVPVVAACKLLNRSR